MVNQVQLKKGIPVIIYEALPKDFRDQLQNIEEYPLANLFEDISAFFADRDTEYYASLYLTKWQEDFVERLNKSYNKNQFFKAELKKHTEDIENIKRDPFDRMINYVVDKTATGYQYAVLGRNYSIVLLFEMEELSGYLKFNNDDLWEYNRKQKYEKIAVALNTVRTVIVGYAHAMFAEWITKYRKEYFGKASQPSAEKFSESEKQWIINNIDRVLSDIGELKAGQEVIWTDLMNELDELKTLFYLNKKHWRQILAGKIMEMVAAGIISEEVSKRIADSVNPVVEKLLQ